MGIISGASRHPKYVPFVREFRWETYGLGAVRAVATFEATEAAASVVFRTIASVKTVLLRPFSHYVNLPVSPSITPSLSFTPGSRPTSFTNLLAPGLTPRTLLLTVCSEHLGFYRAFLPRDAAMLARSCLSVRLPVCHTRALWLIQRTYRRYFYTTRKGNPSSFLMPKISAKFQTAIFDQYLAISHKRCKIGT